MFWLLLSLIIFLAWLLLFIAGIAEGNLAKARRGLPPEKRGVSCTPVSFMFPAIVCWLACGLGLYVHPWIAWGIGAVHVAFSVFFLVSIVRSGWELRSIDLGLVPTGANPQNDGRFNTQEATHMGPASDPAPLFGPEMVEAPYPIYQRFRDEAPVYWSEKCNAWIVTGFYAVAAGLHEPRLSSDRARLFQEMAGSPELEPFFSFLSKRMVLTDPPQHARLRALVSKAFTPHAVEAMRPHIQRLVDGFLDKVEPSGRMDFIRDLAFPLPATVIIEMLGLPPEDVGLLKKWSDAFIVFFSTHPANVTLEQYRAALQSMRDMVDYFRAAMPRIRKEASPSLLKMMELADNHGDRLTEEELFANANLLLVAGHESTTNLLGNGLLALLTHPDQMRRLADAPSLVAGAVEEFLRYDTPVQFTHRVAREDVPLGDKVIRRGQFVILFLAAANRDPAHFANPDQLDITRPDHKHLAFGVGQHYCLGAPLARLEAQLAFTTVLRRLPNLRLTGEKLVYRDNPNLRGLESLPLAFD
jgi:cytochrome P450